MDKLIALNSDIKNSNNEEAKKLINELGIEAAYYGNTPLMLAVAFQNREIFDYLIDADANVNTVADNGATPLILASETGSLHMVKRLLERKADVNAADVHGNTALMKAIIQSTDTIAITTLLLENGADPHKKDNNDFSAYDFAKKYDDVEIIELFDTYKTTN